MISGMHAFWILVGRLMAMRESAAVNHGSTVSVANVACSLWLVADCIDGSEASFSVVEAVTGAAASDPFVLDALGLIREIVEMGYEGVD
jgi:hypothetical protein